MGRGQRLILPGTTLADPEMMKRIAASVLSLTNAGETQRVDAWRKHWIRLETVDAAVRKMGTGEHYVLYQHPVVRRFDQLSLASMPEIEHFLRTWMDPERMRGLDMTICPKDLSSALMCNHDGDLFWYSPPDADVAPVASIPGDAGN